MGGESGREWRHVCVWLSHFAVRRKPSQHCNQLRVRTLSHVQLFATPWTVTRQAPLSMEFSRREYWSGLPFPMAGSLCWAPETITVFSIGYIPI